MTISDSGMRVRGPDKYSEKQGFTLIEMMVSITILFIVATLFGLNFSRLVSDGNLSTAQELFRFDVRRARAEAASLGGRVIVSLNGAGTQYTVGVDYSPYSAIFTPDTVLFTRRLPSNITAAFSTTLLFDPRGFVITSTEVLTTVTATFTNAVTSQSLTVSSTGNVT